MNNFHKVIPIKRIREVLKLSRTRNMFYLAELAGRVPGPRRIAVTTVERTALEPDKYLAYASKDSFTLY